MLYYILFGHIDSRFIKTMETVNTSKSDITDNLGMGIRTITKALGSPIESQGEIKDTKRQIDDQSSFLVAEFKGIKDRMERIHQENKEGLERLHQEKICVDRVRDEMAALGASSRSFLLPSFLGAASVYPNRSLNNIIYWLAQEDNDTDGALSEKKRLRVLLDNAMKFLMTKGGNHGSEINSDDKIDRTGWNDFDKFQKLLKDKLNLQIIQLDPDHYGGNNWKFFLRKVS